MAHPAAIQHPREVPSGYPQGPRAHILLVDDDAAVRSVTGVMLERFGHRVQAAGDGRAALEGYQRSAADPFDLVLLDVHMPGMDGAEVLHALRSIDPTVRVLMMSGGLGEDLNEHGGASGFLQKPFTLDDLRTAVRAALPASGAVLPST